MSTPQPDIRFDEERHEYHVGALRFPSVSEILRPIQELEGIPKATLDAAAAFGRHVHLACHLSNLGVLDEATLDPRIAPYLAQWKACVRQARIVVTGSELMVINPRHRYAGTLDVKGFIRKKPALFDIKTSATIPRTVGPQTAAYAEAVAPGDRKLARYCVHLTPEGFRLVHLTDRNDLTFFLSALNIWRYLNNGR